MTAPSCVIVIEPDGVSVTPAGTPVVEAFGNPADDAVTAGAVLTGWGDVEVDGAEVGAGADVGAGAGEAVTGEVAPLVAATTSAVAVG